MTGSIAAIDRTRQAVDGSRRAVDHRRVPARAISPTVPVEYLDDMLDRSRASSEIRAACLRAAGIDPALARSPRLRLTSERFVAAYTTLRAAIADELFGFFARPIPIGSYATLARLVVGSRDVASALDNGFRFYRLFDPHRYWEIAVVGDEARLAVHPRDDGQAASAVFVYTMLLSPVRLAAWLVGHELPIRRVVLDPRLRRHAADARFAFGVGASWAAGEYAVALDASVLAMPVVRSEADATEYAKRSLGALFAASRPGTLESDLRRVVAAAGTSELSLATAARRLGVSAASLSRGLFALGTSFRRVVDDIRRDRAISLLRTRRTSLADVADALGFAEPSAFHRAFKRWTGLTPIQYRATLL
jgi:AraC-like DNA-binding protein